MTPSERRSTSALASIFALRTLGLFLVLPVFALEASKYPGGDNPVMVGLAMGMYGLTQAVLQIPFGMASDRLGRKKVIIAGLLVFVIGSLVAAFAGTLNMLLLGRALQGAGAISAAITALLADQTRDEVRTKAMAFIGGSIALMFALSLVIAPMLVTFAGLSGLFGLTATLAALGIAVVAWVVPDEVDLSHRPRTTMRSGLRAVLVDRSLLRLDFGVFVLHSVQIAMWVAVPSMLVHAGLPKAAHWHVYLPAVLASFVAMAVTLFPMERKGRLREALLGAIALIGAVQLGFWAISSPSMLTGFGAGGSGLWPLAVLLFAFFVGFNAIEASQPSLVSRMAPAHLRGAALGVYNTLQSLGLFAGGALGGVVVKFSGVHGLFAVTFGLTVIWFVVTFGLRIVGRNYGRDAGVHGVPGVRGRGR